MLKLENLSIALFGLVTVFVFLLMLSLGGLFESVKSFLFLEVSFLISPYTPLKDLTIPIFQYYLYFLFLFSFALTVRMRSAYAKVGGLYLLLSAVIGLILLKYPLDPGRISGSVAGVTHISIVLFMSLYTAVALYLLAYAFKNTNNLSWLSSYSMLVCLLLLFGGFATGIFAIFSLPIYVGLTQKLPIASYLFWILLTAFGMLKSDKRIHHYFYNIDA